MSFHATPKVTETAGHRLTWRSTQLLLKANVAIFFDAISVGNMRVIRTAAAAEDRTCLPATG
jgi:hypothetical protein